jgi:hypothetical protein
MVAAGSGRATAVPAKATRSINKVQMQILLGMATYCPRTAS